MDKKKDANDISDDGDSSMNVSAMDISDPNPDNSINYQTADEDNSRYFSVIEDDSTLEDITGKDFSLPESEQSTMTIQCDDKTVESVNLSQSGIDNVENSTDIVSDEIAIFDEKSMLTIQSEDKSMDSVNVPQEKDSNVTKLDTHENLDDLTNADIFDDKSLTIESEDLKSIDSNQISIVENVDDSTNIVSETDDAFEDKSMTSTQCDDIVDDAQVSEIHVNENVVDSTNISCEVDDIFDDQSTKTIHCDDKSVDDVSVQQVSKFNVHENVDDSTTIVSGDVDIFDDNESSVDGHDLVIDDDPQPSVKSDDCQESADAQYKYEEDASQENNVITIKDTNFSMLKKNHFASGLLDAIENTNMSQGTNDSDSRASCKVDIKDLFGDSEENGLKSDSYNFPEGSHRVTLQMDGRDIEAINIGQDIYIYENEGALTAFQVLKEDGNSKIKFLNITKNDDGNIELYEEQVNQVPVTNEDSVEVAEKNKSDGSTVVEQHKVPEMEKNSHRVIQAITNQGKKSPLIDNTSNTSPVKIIDIPNVDCKKVEDESEVLKVGIKLDENSSAEKLLGDLQNGEVLKANEDIEKIDDFQKELVSIMDGGDNDNMEEEDKITLYASRDNEESTVVKLKKFNEDLSNSPIKSLSPREENEKIIPPTVDSDDDESSIIEGEPVTGDCELEWIMKDANDTNKVDENKIAPAVQPQSSPNVINEDIVQVEKNKAECNFNIAVQKTLLANDVAIKKIDKKSETVLSIEEGTTLDDIDSFEPVVNRNVFAVKTYSKESKLKTKLKNQISSSSEDCAVTVTNAEITNSNSNGIESNLKKDLSPSLKNRQPRKQIFTPVATSDIEIIFLNNKNKPTESQDESVIKSPLKVKEELSSSDRRKRGRPKRIISESTEVKTPEEQSDTVTSIPDDDLISTDDSKSSNNKENDSALVQNADAAAAVIEKQSTENVDIKTDEHIGEKVNVPSTSGKRKKGRPKKILSSSFCSAMEDVKVEVSRKSLPIMFHNPSSNSSELKSEDDENICPLCNKNFRSKNVLFKHAKHCCGVTEIVKSPKRKKLSTDCNETPSTEVECKPSIVKEIVEENIREKSVDKEKHKEKVKDSQESSSGKEMRKEKIKDDKKPSLDKEIRKAKIEDSQESSKDKEMHKEKVEVSQESLLDRERVEIKNPAMKRCKVESKSSVMASPMTRLSKIMKMKPPLLQIIKCEICGKIFRQLAHKVNHQRSHAKEKIVKKEEVIVKEDKDVESDTILKCEVCQKGFRKLHHLVAHREVHNEVKSRRTSLSVRSNESEAGFRCEICEKSFRKMHHLVEHRQLHVAESTNGVEVKIPTVAEENATCNGCGKSFRKRHHMIEHRDVHCSPSKIKKDSSDSNLRLSITSINSDDSNNCSICGKSYRKLHHMVEHRESHAETSASKSVLDRLSTKDIIHECSKCYMVFPNTNSLDKHMTKCLTRKLARRTIIGGEAVQDKPVSLIPKRKSVDSTTKESVAKRVVNKEVVRSNIILRKSIIKVPVKSTTKIPSVAQAKRAKLDTKENETNEQYKESDDDDDDDEEENVRYSLNPDYKSSPDCSEQSAPDTTDTKGIERESETNTSEDESTRYSFPISLKDKEAPKSTTKAPVSPVKPIKRSVGVPRKSIITTVATPKKTILPRRDTRKSAVTLLVKRASLGGRKTLESRKLPAPKKLQLRCCGQIFQTQASLALHRKSHKVAHKVHKCDCGKQFENEILLKRHMDTEHTPPKSFKCQYCDVSMRTAAQYAKHKKTHDDNKASTAQVNKVARKSLRGGVSEVTADKKTITAPTPMTIRKKRRIAHGGVPLSEKMKKALANAKF